MSRCHLKIAVFLTPLLGRRAAHGQQAVVDTLVKEVFQKLSEGKVTWWSLSVATLELQFSVKKI